MDNNFTPAELRSLAAQLKENRLFQHLLLTAKQGGINSFVSSDDPESWAKSRNQVHFALDWEAQLENAINTPDAEAAE